MVSNSSALLDLEYWGVPDVYILRVHREREMKCIYDQDVDAQEVSDHHKHDIFRC